MSKKWTVVEDFEMVGGGRACRLRSPSGRIQRVDYLTRSRVEEYGVDANVEMDPNINDRGKYSTPKFTMGMVRAIVSIREEE